MKYKGLFCQFKMTDDLMSYRVNKIFTPFARLRRFNPQVEIPVNIIVNYEIKRYASGVKGLLLYIQSSSKKHRVKKLRPINISFLPGGLVKKVLKHLDDQIELAEKNKN